MNRCNLSEYRVNHFSQNGEDGVIEKIFEIAGIKNGFLVEFGAWDGIHFSNTRHHYLTKRFKILLIEPDPVRYWELEKNYPERSAILINSFVNIDKYPTLNDIFDLNKVENIALLSIDVDGEDVEIWKTLDTNTFRPKVVVIEFSKWQDKEALDDFAKVFYDKGYDLVHVTGNFIFVDRNLGITSQSDIHSLMRCSGLPEYDNFFGLISDEEVVQRNIRKETEKDIYCRQAGEQVIEFN